MSPQMGRPKSENPKTYEVKARLEKETYDRLKIFCKKNKKSVSDVLRMGINEVLDK